MLGIIALALYALTIPAANWLIGNVGTICIPEGPCMIPVGFGMMAPSGVLMVGAALVLRDVVHKLMGWQFAAMAIVVGAGVSALFAPASLVIASVAAFTFSEAADFAIYAPLEKRNFPLAVALSGIAGAALDSAIFLWLAFGSLDHMDGQFFAKAIISVVVGAGLWAWRRAHV